MNGMPGAVDGDGDEAGCANCGKQGSDTAKLKICTCRLVKYCSVDCQKAHRKQHKKACKQRAAELNNEMLYNQGHERPEECPICTLPIPLRLDKHSYFNVCCMKMICHGCDIAAQKRGMFSCPFCRTPSPEDDAGKLAKAQARAKKKDPVALNFLGEQFCFGALGLPQSMSRAFKLWEEAAELGSVSALFSVGVAYYEGEGVREDKEKAAEYLSKAAMQGHAESRHNLGCMEETKGNSENAVRHWLISAKMGFIDSLEAIKESFVGGLVTKEQYTEALKGYQNAVEEMKSHERDEAKAFMKSQGVID